MSWRREVLIRILALLQRKTLIETKNRTLKWHYWTVRSIKNVALLTEDGAFALFFRPHPGGFDSSRVPTLGNLPSKAKKMLMPGGQPGGALGAAGIDWCIIKTARKQFEHYIAHSLLIANNSQMTPSFSVSSLPLWGNSEVTLYHFVSVSFEEKYIRN